MRSASSGGSLPAPAKSITQVVPPHAAAMVPLSKSSADVTAPTARSKCVWASMPPGMTYAPVASTTSAPDGGSRWPTAAIRSPSIRRSPVPAPPEGRVASGPSGCVRNRRSEAVVALAAGQGLLFGSVAVLVYAGVLVATFHLFVTLYEEPHLRSQFGPDYEAYCQRVGRWLP